MGGTRNNRDLILGTISTVALAIIVVIALLHIKGLDEEIVDYMEQLEVMTERGDEAELQSRELARNIVMLQEELKLLEDQAGALTDISEDLESKADELENEKNELAAWVDELERQNGELIKKFDGLSKPN